MRRTKDHKRSGLHGDVKRLLPHGTRLAREYNHGKRVWVAACAQHAVGVHRYTLTNGVACWAWWATLSEAHEYLQRKTWEKGGTS